MAECPRTPPPPRARARSARLHFFLTISKKKRPSLPQKRVPCHRSSSSRDALSLAGVAKMIPGVGGQISASQLSGATSRLKKSEAMIGSMTAKERRSPSLLLEGREARSRLDRIARGCGNTYDDALGFMSEFSKMRTMMARMQRQMGEGEPEKAMASGDTQAMAAGVGNRR